jgi:hypothetical protein
MEGAMTSGAIEILRALPGGAARAMGNAAGQTV